MLDGKVFAERLWNDDATKVLLGVTDGAFQILPVMFPDYRIHERQTAHCR